MKPATSSSRMLQPVASSCHSHYTMFYYWNRLHFVLRSCIQIPRIDVMLISIAGIEPSIVPMKYPCCRLPYNRLKFMVHLRRKSLYYIFNFVIPCCAFSIVSLATFLLPPGCGERIGLSKCINRLDLYLNWSSIDFRLETILSTRYFHAFNAIGTKSTTGARIIIILMSSTTAGCGMEPVAVMNHL